MKHQILLLLMVSLLFVGCSCNKKTSKQSEILTVLSEEASSKENMNNQPNTAVAKTARAIIYKTKRDYAKNIPVLLSADKKKIISYPAPSDIYYQGKFAYPTPLADGYLLDNRGINQRVAFTDYTYEEYAKLETTPPLTELYQRIIDKSPLIFWKDCGERHLLKDEVKYLNEIIKKINNEAMNNVPILKL